MAEASVESPQPETSAGGGLAVMQGSPSNECSSSPPPNCAICLGNCINKCFSDSCMHQFCFKCLLEWSKVKAVCPLCKQPFKSIIHNVKSNVEYDQHFVPPPASTEARFEDLVWRDTSRHFQFRTTLTVDPRGELAIQHLLSTRSMTNSLPRYTRMNVLRHVGDYLRTHRHRDVSSSNYRRSLYERNLYTHPMTDVTGRYREATSSFFREYPGSKNRLVPFLQREVNALLPDERSLRAMNLVHRILAAIDDHPIRGRYMKNMLRPEMGDNTEHFLYEFYTYARSPFDLWGYDHNAQLLNAEPTITEDSSDSDVLIVSVERAPARLTSEVIEIASETSNDSDVVIREPTPPVTVDLACTTSSSDDNIPLKDISTNQQQQDSSISQPPNVHPKRSRMNSSIKRRHDIYLSSSESDVDGFMEDARRVMSRKRSLLLKAREARMLSQADDGSSSDEMEPRAKRKKLRKKKHYRNKHEPTPQDQIASTSTSTASPVNNTSIKNENENDHDTHSASAHELYQRTGLGVSNLNLNMNSWFPDYGEHHHSDMGPVHLPKVHPSSMYYNDVKYAEARRTDEPGPSGMSSGVPLWQPKPCSDSD